MNKAASVPIIGSNSREPMVSLWEPTKHSSVPGFTLVCDPELMMMLDGTLPWAVPGTDAPDASPTNVVSLDRQLRTRGYAGRA